MITKSFFKIPLFLTVTLLHMSHAIASEVAQQQPGISNCESVTLVQKNVGNSYRGRVTNDDYSMLIVIPDGLVGWGGVAEGAPFHGFTIFLGKSENSNACIDFDIQLRINEEDRPIRQHPSHRINLKNISGWQSINQASNKGVDVIIVTTLVSYTRAGDIIDSKITMIIPKNKYPKEKVVYDTFINSFKITSTE